MRLLLAARPSVDDVLEVVVRIAEQFKQLVEINKLSALLYDSDGRKKREEASQLLFYGIADSYCEANDLDLSRETNGGRGPVDFKVSKGYEARVVAECKLSTNPQLVHGYEVRTRRSVYVVIDVGGSDARLKALHQHVIVDRAAGKDFPQVVYIDGRQKESASKYKSIGPRWDGLR